MENDGDLFMNLKFKLIKFIYTRLIIQKRAHEIKIRT
jgi:hypothetical protein